MRGEKMQPVIFFSRRSAVLGIKLELNSTTTQWRPGARYSKPCGVPLNKSFVIIFIVINVKRAPVCACICVVRVRACACVRECLCLRLCVCIWRIIINAPRR